jgi:hypothetical protein
MGSPHPCGPSCFGTLLHVSVGEIHLRLEHTYVFWWKRATPARDADSLQCVIKKTRLIMISHALPGYGVAIFDHEAIHVGCSFRSSLLNGVERQKDNDPQDREHGHDHPAPPSTFS